MGLIARRRRIELTVPTSLLPLGPVGDSVCSDDLNLVDCCSSEVTDPIPDCDGFGSTMSLTLSGIHTPPLGRCVGTYNVVSAGGTFYDRQVDCTHYSTWSEGSYTLQYAGTTPAGPPGPGSPVAYVYLLSRVGIPGGTIREQGFGIPPYDTTTVIDPFAGECCYGAYALGSAYQRNDGSLYVRLLTDETAPNPPLGDGYKLLAQEIGCSVKIPCDADTLSICEGTPLYGTPAWVNSKVGTSVLASPDGSYFGLWSDGFPLGGFVRAPFRVTATAARQIVLYVFPPLVSGDPCTIKIYMWSYLIFRYSGIFDNLNGFNAGEAPFHAITTWTNNIQIVGFSYSTTTASVDIDVPFELEGCVGGFGPGGVDYTMNAVLSA